MSQVVVTGIGPLLANCAARQTLWSHLRVGPSQLVFEPAPGRAGERWPVGRIAGFDPARWLSRFPRAYDERYHPFNVTCCSGAVAIGHACRALITPDLVPETDFELAPGDTMLLPTDGVSEYPGPRDMFGFERVHAELIAHAELGPAQVVEAITDKLAAHGRVQEDDVTLLALMYVGPVDHTTVS